MNSFLRGHLMQFFATANCSPLALEMLILEIEVGDLDRAELVYRLMSLHCDVGTMKKYKVPSSD